MFNGIYQGKRILVTGHTGFKGAWVSLWLNQLGAQVFGYALAPRSEWDLYAALPGSVFQREWIADLRDTASLESAIEVSAPDLIIHMAAQPLVRLSYQEPLETFSVNALGTATLLDAVRRLSCGAALLVVTSDKCYRNTNAGRPFREDDPLGGSDVYSMSKAATELVAASWHASFFSRDDRLGPMATARAGNVIGGGDYAPDRIVPDCVRAQLSGDKVCIRNPAATRPWQHVLECLSGYLALGERLLCTPEKETLISLNFGPEYASERTVGEVVEAFYATWLGEWEVRPDPNAVPEATRLTLDHSLAGSMLSWRPVWDFATTLIKTAEWYAARHTKADLNVAELTRRQIEEYAADAVANELAWALN